MHCHQINSQICLLLNPGVTSAIPYATSGFVAAPSTAVSCLFFSSRFSPVREKTQDNRMREVFNDPPVNSRYRGKRPLERIMLMVVTG